MKDRQTIPSAAQRIARWIPAAALLAAIAPLHAATPASSATTSPATTVVPAVKTVADTASVPFSSREGATLFYVR